MTTTTTPEKRIKFTKLNVLRTVSFVMNAHGTIKSMHAHTPHSQYSDRSFEDFLSMIFTMSGMFQIGMTTDATRARISRECIGPCLFAPYANAQNC